MTTPISVGSDVKEPTHHISLTDKDGASVGLIVQGGAEAIARNPVDRSTLKTSTGNQTYSDLKPPYAAIVQNDWSGGRGNLQFEKDATRFLDSLRVNTARGGRVILGGRETYSNSDSNLGTSYNNLPGAMKMISLIGARQYLKTTFPILSTFYPKSVWMWIRYIGKPKDDLHISVFSPGDVNRRYDVTISTDDLDEFISEMRATVLTLAPPPELPTAQNYFTITANPYTAATGNQTSLVFDVTLHNQANGSLFSVRPDYPGHQGCGVQGIRFTSPNDGYDHTYRVRMSMRLAYQGHYVGGVTNSVHTIQIHVAATGRDTITQSLDVTDIHQPDSSGFISIDHTYIVPPNTNFELDYCYYMVYPSDDNTFECILNLESLGYSMDTEAVIQVWGNDLDDEDNQWQVGCKPSTGSTDQSATGNAWAVATGIDLCYRLHNLEAADASKGILFQYKGVEYLVTQPPTGASKVFMNGYRGSAVSNSGTLGVLNAANAPGWPVDGLVGGVVQIIEGPGITEEQNYRTIVSNTAGVITVDHAWVIAHTVDTVFVVLGLNIWKLLTTTEIGYKVTDVLVSSKNVVYFCQGDDGFIIRMNEAMSTGTWTRTLAAETYHAVFMEEFNENGTMQILKSNTDATVAKAPTPDWGAALAFVAALDAGEAWNRITNLVRYLDGSFEVVWILEEGSNWVFKWTINAGLVVNTVERAPLGEYAAVASEKNGRAACRQGAYLFYSVMNTVNRFYSPTLDDVGPSLDEGLPPVREGPVVSLAGYPGRVFAAIDAGDTGYSSVLECAGGSSWHEVYRAPLGHRIHAIGFQVIPGSAPDRLWVRQGYDLLWVAFPSDNFDPYQDTNYPYQHEGVLTLSSLYSGLMDAYKYWQMLKLQAENISNDGTAWLEADYRLEDETEWHTFNDKFEVGPIPEVPFGIDGMGENSKRLDLRIRLYCTDGVTTPRLLAVIVNAVAVTTPKYGYSFSALVNEKNLLGQDEDQQPWQIVAQMDTWCGQARPLFMRCNNPLYDKKNVFLSPIPTRAANTSVDTGKSEYLGQIIVQEV